jgi:hypothetical protein
VAAAVGLAYDRSQNERDISINFPENSILIFFSFEQKNSALGCCQKITVGDPF